MKKVLLIEDNREISENIKEFLELEHLSVVQAFDGEVGIEKATREDYDIILLDLMLPEVDGISIARRVVQKKNTPIIMITARESLHDKLLGFDTGAVDYLVKPFDLSELLARMRVHMEKYSLEAFVGGVEKSEYIFHIQGVEVDLKKHSFAKDGQDIHLTQKEFLIVEKLIYGRDSVVVRADIIEYLWGGDSLFDGDNKLDVYISNIRSKLGKNFVKTIKGVGYMIGK